MRQDILHQKLRGDGCTEGYGKILTQVEGLSSPYCTMIIQDPSVLWVLPDKSGSITYGDPENLQVHATVMCTEIQALQ